MPDEPIPEPEAKTAGKSEEADTHADSESASEEDQSSSSSDSENEEQRKLQELEKQVCRKFCCLFIGALVVETSVRDIPVLFMSQCYVSLLVTLQGKVVGSRLLLA